MTHDSVSEVAKIINCLQGTSEAHGEVAAKIMNLLASREQAAAENAARVIVKAVENTKAPWNILMPPGSTREDAMRIECIAKARSAAAPFMKNKGE